MKLVVFTSALAGVASSSVESAFLSEASLRGWSVGVPVADDTRIELTFAVKQQNIDELLKTFTDVSDPKSDAYGQHLSFDQVNELTAPHPEALAAVEAVVQSLGAIDVRRTPNSDFIVAEVTAANAEFVFGGDFLQLVHDDGRKVVRNPHAALPEALSAAVDFVMPLNQMVSRGGPLRVETMDADLTSPNALGLNTPKSLRKLYNVVGESGGIAGNKQAFTGFLEQYWTNVDLQAFNTAYNHAGMGEKPARQVGDGRTGVGRIAGVEAELDAQYMMAMGLHVETEFWSFAGRNPENDANEPFLKWMSTLGNISDAPLIISTSYGEDEDSMSLEYQNRCNIEFQKAGVRGISLLFASGDFGVGGAVKCSEQCDAYAQGEKCFQAMWPAGSPYVTAVGGTKGSAPETAAGLSAGGFSYRWPMPDWQKDAVAAFLAQDGQPDTSLYTTTGRGYPDLSAQAVNYMVIAFGVPSPVAGTSAAAPTAAGIFSLVNDRRLAAGQSPLGFLNPLLYANAGALNDVVGGNNPGCDSDGFTAVQGWDPVTGLGTPNFASLAALPAGNKAVLAV